MGCQFLSSQNWQPLHGNLEWYTTCLYADSVSDQLFVGGRFKEVNNQTQWGIGTYNGTQWGQLGSGIDDSSLTNRPAKTTAITRYGSDVIIGGWFSKAGGLNTPALASWDGASWDTVPGALMKSQDVVNDLIVFNNELYMCGAFDSVGNVPANCIAKWNGSTWTAIGNNYPFIPQGVSLNKMCFYRGNLYVIGWFLDLQGNFCRLAKWDGTVWTFYTNSFTNVFAFNDLIVFQDKLYIAGLFSMSDMKCGIMSWNDTTWSGVGGGLQTVVNPNPEVIELAVYHNKLFCVGNFEKVGGAPADGLASWDGTYWCGYGTSFQINSQNVGATNIAFYRDTMYIGGGFEMVEGDTIEYIAQWAGGNFADTCNVISTDVNGASNFNSALNLFPNPARDEITFEFTDSENRQLIIYDCAGREIWREENSGAIIKVDVQSFSDGLYFFSAFGDNEEYVQGKFLIAH
jgi:hypothetical protein